MEIPQDKKDIPVRCYLIGRRKTLTFQEAYDLFWSLPFAWLIPLDWFRSGSKQGYLRDFVKKSVKVCAYNLFTRGFLALPINAPSMLDDHSDPPSRNNFQSKACRLSKIFEGKPPFLYDECFDEKKKLEPAYRMIPGQEWLIVVGVDSKSAYDDTDVDWTIFQLDLNQG